MKTSQVHLRSMIWLICFCSVLPGCTKAGAEQITLARAVQLSKQHTVSIPGNRSEESDCRPERVWMQMRLPEISDRSDFNCQAPAGGILEDTDCEAYFRTRWIISNSQESCRSLDGGSSEDAIANTALEYIQLVWARAQLSARQQQYELVRHLVVIERMRAKAGVDDNAVLYRAKLLEAQSRMRAASAEAEVLELRRSLAARIGVSAESLEIVPESVPALPAIEGDIGSGQVGSSRSEFALLNTKVKEATAARDAAQLAYYLAYRDANRASASTTATLGDQITSQIRDQEKFLVLLNEIVEVQQSELVLLVIAGNVEEWAIGNSELARGPLPSGGARQQALPTLPQNPGMELQGKVSMQKVSAPLVKSATPSSKQTIMILPPESRLAMHECKQLAAVEIADGKGSDITSVANWSSSNESVAVVSTSGLVTAIGTGDALIAANLDGVSRLVHVAVVDNIPSK